MKIPKKYILFFFFSFNPDDFNVSDLLGNNATAVIQSIQCLDDRNVSLEQCERLKTTAEKP